jgi:hypothetical protein
MNSRALSYLGLTTVAVIVIAWGIHLARAPSTTQADAPLYPELKGKLESIQTIKLYGSGDKLEVQLDKDSDARYVVQQRNYPADSNKVRRLLIDLENAKRREEKTSNPDNYAALGVQSTSDANSKNARIELVGTPVNLIVGKNDSSGRANYVRRAEDKASWLTDVSLEVSTDPRQWLQRDIVDIASDRIASIKVEITDQKSYELFKKARGDANFDVSVPKGRELESVSTPNAAAQTFTALTLDDVEVAKNLSVIKVIGKATVTTYDGLILDCTGYQTADVHWIAINKVTFDETLAKKHFVADSKASQEEADKALQDALKKSADDAAALNKKLSDWAYAIPTHKFDSLFKPMEQLLKKK